MKRLLSYPPGRWVHRQQLPANGADRAYRLSRGNLDKPHMQGTSRTRGFLDHPQHRFVKGDIRRHGFGDRADRAVPASRPLSFRGRESRGPIHHRAQDLIDNNVCGTLTLLLAARDKGIQTVPPGLHGRGLRLLGAQGHSRNRRLCRPTLRTRPARPPADMLVAAFGHTFGLPYNSPDARTTTALTSFPEKLIPLMINNALQDRPLPSMATGCTYGIGSMCTTTARPYGRS